MFKWHLFQNPCWVLWFRNWLQSHRKFEMSFMLYHSTFHRILSLSKWKISETSFISFSTDCSNYGNRKLYFHIFVQYFFMFRNGAFSHCLTIFLELKEISNEKTAFAAMFSNHTICNFNGFFPVLGMLLLRLIARSSSKFIKLMAEIAKFNQGSTTI